MRLRVVGLIAVLLLLAKSSSGQITYSLSISDNIFGGPAQWQWQFEVPQILTATTSIGVLKSWATGGILAGCSIVSVEIDNPSSLVPTVYTWFAAPCGGPDGMTYIAAYAQFTGPIDSSGDHTAFTHSNIPDGLLTIISGFAITKPEENMQFPLTESFYTATSPITFEAGLIATGATVQWTAQLKYATSTGRGSFQDLRNFTTDSTNTTHDETYVGIGGKVTVNAKETGSNQSAQPITIYIVGKAIPDADITARLDSLYGGATPNLMTGIAARESTYLQFVKRAHLFGVSALWPTESYDGGSHIGLMQMPTTEADAWNWTANTQDAVNFFVTAKLPIAIRLTNRIIASHPGLRQLTAVELEHMAVCLYGDGASSNLSKQYYVPYRPASGGWDWGVNNDGNTKGYEYVLYVFSYLR